MTCDHYPQTRSTWNILRQLRRAESAGQLYYPSLFPQFGTMAYGPMLLGPPPQQNSPTLSIASCHPSLGSPTHMRAPSFPCPRTDELRTSVWLDPVVSDQNSPRFCPEQQRGSGVPGPDLLLFTPRKLIFHRGSCRSSWVSFFFACYLPRVWPRETLVLQINRSHINQHHSVNIII